MGRSYFQIEINIDDDSIDLLDRVFRFLEKLDIYEWDIIENNIDQRLFYSFIVFDRDEAESILTKLTQKFPPIHCQLNTFAEEDFLLKDDGSKSAKLTKKVTLVSKASEDNHQIFMPYQEFFGDGSHASTRLMAQFIEDNAGNGKSFLDIGTGTGVLAIMAMKNGFEKIVINDLNQEIIQQATENIKANGLSLDQVQTFSEGFAFIEIDDQFDFVAVNVISSFIKMQREKILKLVAPNGFVALSGVTLYFNDDIKQLFTDSDWKLKKEEKREGWVALLYQRINH